LVRRRSPFAASLREFVIGTAASDRKFCDFLSLRCDSEISLNSESRSFLLSISRGLENYEIYRSFKLHSNDMTFFIFEFENFVFFESASERAISFLASYFYEIERSFLSRLPISAVEAILSHESRIMRPLFPFCCGALTVSMQLVSLCLSSKCCQFGFLWQFRHRTRVCASPFRTALTSPTFSQRRRCPSLNGAAPHGL
jgi:hypothetical protein